MDLSDLQALIDEIRNGREEDTATEWKRQWWDLRNAKASAEYVKDVAAMANANTKNDRVMVVGLSGAGVLQDAPLPEDEAKLQQRLQAIEPTPHVRFSTLRIEGHTISTIEIHEPFDKPYVARSEGKNMIFVRQGSMIVTATRAMLDRWYEESRGTAKLRLLVAGDDVAESGAVFEFSRPRHVPEPDNQNGLWRLPLPLMTDPAKVADHRNRDTWLTLELANVAKRAATHVVVDLEMSPVEKLRLWDESHIALRTQRWQTNPSENCYVDGWGTHQGMGTVRQRVARINPQTTERLVPVGILAMSDSDGSPVSVAVSYRVTDEHGERLAGRFEFKVVFDGTIKIVKPQQVF
jgi:hypothetical protein